MEFEGSGRGFVKNNAAGNFVGFQCLAVNQWVSLKVKYPLWDINTLAAHVKSVSVLGLQL